MVSGVGPTMDAYTMAMYMSPLMNQVQGLQQINSFREMQQQAQPPVQSFTASVERIQALGKETSGFLSQYTNDMNQLSQSAGSLADGNLQGMLFDAGEVTQDSLSQTGDAMQNLVDNYNDSLQNLYDNSERGPAVEEQARRLADTGLSEEEMQQLGLTQNEDGTLALNRDAFQQALSAAAQPENSSQLQQLESSITRLTEDIQNDAQVAAREPAGRLVANDLSQMRGGAVRQQQLDPLQSFATYAQRGGSLEVSNQMAAGILMNFAV